MHRLAPLLLLALLGGCYSDEAAITHAVWSDDDQGQAWVESTWEESWWDPPLPESSPARRNHAFKLWIRNMDGTGARQVLGKPGFVGMDFYYFRDAGYLLFDRQDEGYAETRWELARVDDGSLHTLHTEQRDDSAPMSPCEHFEVLPAPDGQHIALIERVPPSNVSCTGGSLTVDFVDPLSLAVTAHAELPMDGLPGTLFDPAGDLIVWNGQGDAWRVETSGSWTTASEPTCTAQRTSSSNVSAAGVEISPGPSPTDPILVTARNVQSCF